MGRIEDDHVHTASPSLANGRMKGVVAAKRAIRRSQTEEIELSHFGLGHFQLWNPAHSNKFMEDSGNINHDPVVSHRQTIFLNDGVVV